MGLNHSHPHKHAKYNYCGCSCTFCKPELDCQCDGCKGISNKKFRVTMLDHDGEVLEVNGNNPPDFLGKRAPGSTMDMSWWWDGYVLKLEVGQHIDGDWRRVTRIE